MRVFRPQRSADLAMRFRPKARFGHGGEIGLPDGEAAVEQADAGRASIVPRQSGVRTLAGAPAGTNQLVSSCATTPFANSSSAQQPSG
jgi:hypothetical protein